MSPLQPSDTTTIIHSAKVVLDDAITDAIGDASSAVCQGIAQAPVSCLSDIADKFRFAASLIEEDGGMLYAEPETVIAAVSDLLAWRNAEAPQGRCSFYAALSVS